jgi:hypothetical protein
VSYGEKRTLDFRKREDKSQPMQCVIANAAARCAAKAIVEKRSFGAQTWEQRSNSEAEPRGRAFQGRALERDNRRSVAFFSRLPYSTQSEKLGKIET